MSTVTKFILAAVASFTVLTSAAQAEDREGGPGVVVGEITLDPSLASEAQGE